MAHPMSAAIAPCQFESSGRDVGGIKLCLRKVQGQGDGDGSAACADISDEARTRESCVSQLNCGFDEELGVGSGDEGAGRNLEVDAEEFLVASDISGGLMPYPALYKGREGDSLIGQKLLSRVDIKTDTFNAQDVCQENLGLEACVVDIVCGEVFCRPVQRLG